LLSERELDHERRQEPKEVERASNNMRLSRRRILFFHKPVFTRGEDSSDQTRIKMSRVLDDI
jgi:hypothetical protein